MGVSTFPSLPPSLPLCSRQVLHGSTAMLQKKSREATFQSSWNYKSTSPFFCPGHIARVIEPNTMGCKEWR